MRKLIIAVSIISASGVIHAQTNGTAKSIATTSFFAEGGGPGIAFSANIDRRFTNSNLGFGGRLGVGFVSAYVPDTTSYYWNDNETSAITLPVQINYIFGKTNSAHSFEVGAGVTYITKKLEIMNFYEDKASKVFATFSFMYRRTPLNGGFSWRAGFTPLFANDYVQPFGAVSVGYNF